MPRRGGIFSRIVNAVRGAFRREEPSRREPPPPPRADRDRQRARERDPYLFWFDRETGGSRNYLAHRDFFDSFADAYDLTEEEKLEMWRDYNHYMVAGKGPYLRKDDRNPFWGKWGINPDRWDWAGWREAMGKMS